MKRTRESWNDQKEAENNYSEMQNTKPIKHNQNDYKQTTKDREKTSNNYKGGKQLLIEVWIWKLKSRDFGTAAQKLIPLWLIECLSSICFQIKVNLDFFYFLLKDKSVWWPDEKINTQLNSH